MLEQNIKIRNENIIKELKKQGYTNKKIDYKEFKILYEPYQEQMSEKEFARLLGMTDSSYKNIKYRGTKTKILKENKEENKEESKEVHKEPKVVVPQKRKREKSEAPQRRKRKKPEVSEERKQEIIKELKEQGYTNKLVTYQEFIKLYEPYNKEMDERDFARLLGILDSNFNNSKYSGTRLRILKEEKPEVSEERKQEIIKELKEQGYTNKLVTYQEFIKLYEPYKKEIDEKDFARLLGISNSNYKHIKNGGQRARILKEEKPEVSEERKQEIEKELRKQGYTNRWITYEEFKILYKPYEKEISEKDFAKILGMSNDDYKNIKNNGQKTRILEILEERKQEIIKELKEQGYENKSINYLEFKTLYKSYKEEMSERELATLLGMLDYIYNSMRYRKTKARITFKRDSIDRVKYQLRRVSREYSKEELENICKENDVTLYDVLIDMYGKKNYIDSLIKRDSIYIGKCEIPREFAEKYAKNLLDIAKNNSKKLVYRYRTLNMAEDYASDSIMHMLQNKGELVKNSEDEKSALEALRAYNYVYIKYRCIEELRVGKPISLDDSMDDGASTRFGQGRTLHSKVADKKVNIEKEAERKEELLVKDSSEIVEGMKECYNQGMNNVEAIDAMIAKYHLSKEELLKIIEEELTKRRRIIKTKSGRVYLGEEVE